jgi:hypothetical protein
MGRIKAVARDRLIRELFKYLQVRRLRSGRIWSDRVRKERDTLGFMNGGHGKGQ